LKVILSDENYNLAGAVETLVRIDLIENGLQNFTRYRLLWAS
jgi:hypothetical protein